MKKINLFISQLEDFINELLKTHFTNEPKAIFLKNSINLFKRTSPKMILDNFNKSIMIFKERILNEDESLLLDPSDEVDNNDLSIIEPLQTLWKKPDFPDNDKKAIWNYLKVLVILADKINNE